MLVILTVVHFFLSRVFSPGLLSLLFCMALLLLVAAEYSPNSITPTSPKFPRDMCHGKVSGKSASCHGEVADMESHGEVSGFQTIAKSATSRTNQRGHHGFVVDVTGKLA